MNGCLDVDPLLSAWIDRSLSSAERVLVGAHLSSCGRCRTEVATLVQVASLLAATPSRVLPPQLRGSLAMARPGDTTPVAAVNPAWVALIVLALAGALAGVWVVDPEVATTRLPTPSPDRWVTEAVARPAAEPVGR